MIPHNQPHWRSLLYVPANAPRFIDKAHERGADALILDLEDSVPMSEKPSARKALPTIIPRVGQSGADVLVRINRPLRLAVQDLEAAVLPGVSALVITKVDGASHVRLLDELVGELEVERRIPKGRLRFILIVETPQAWLSMREIFAASPRNAAAILGSEDFSLECDAAPSDESLLMPKQQLIIHAHASGLLPLGFISSIAKFSDPEKLLVMAQRSRSFGFAGATCIHPSQVIAANQAFMPNAAEFEQAQRIVEAFELAEREGRGAISFEGQMVDAPVVARARRQLKIARTNPYDPQKS